MEVYTITPLKTKINMESKLCTIPKWELVAIRLLIDLTKDVLSSYSQFKYKLYIYTDSRVELQTLIEEVKLQQNF